MHYNLSPYFGIVALCVKIALQPKICNRLSRFVGREVSTYSFHAFLLGYVFSNFSKFLFYYNLYKI